MHHTNERPDHVADSIAFRDDETVEACAVAELALFT